MSHDSEKTVSTMPYVPVDPASVLRVLVNAIEAGDHEQVNELLGIAHAVLAKRDSDRQQEAARLSLPVQPNEERTSLNLDDAWFARAT